MGSWALVYRQLYNSKNVSGLRLNHENIIPIIDNSRLVQMG